MEKMENILDIIYNIRTQEVSILTEEEEQIERKRRSYIETKDYFPKATEEEIKQIENYVDKVIENICNEMYLLNEKHYKTGFADGIKIILECMKRK